VLVAVVLSILAVRLFDLGTHGVKLVGTLPRGLPALTLPGVGWSELPLLLGGAAGIALVALADTIATASPFAERTGEHVDGNRPVACYR
jgi:MFS superfamily sulfate permease-like transporter